MEPNYILYHVNRGWFTKTSQLHSDWRLAQRFPLDEALDMCRLHEGRLIPVREDLYAEVMKGVKQ